MGMNISTPILLAVSGRPQVVKVLRSRVDVRVAATQMAA
jgi:hypothetical protein